MTTAILWALMNLSIMADWHQTRYIANHPDTYWEEYNPILKGHPSQGEVDAFFIWHLAFNNGVMIALPKSYRPYYAGAVTAWQTRVVIRNNGVGLKIEF